MHNGYCLNPTQGLVTQTRDAGVTLGLEYVAPHHYVVCYLSV